MHEKQIVLLRCREVDSRVVELFKSFNSLNQDIRVYAARDRYRVQSPGGARRGAEAQEGLDVLDLDDDFVKSQGLHYFDDPGRTGWACGDYVFYRALEEEWDYAWCIEPDVFFLNNALGVWSYLSQLSHDLLAVDVFRANESWYWSKRIESYFPTAAPHAMAFPLVRVSRVLAEKSLELRQQITEKSGTMAQWVPNDESIVATAASLAGMSTLNLRSIAPSMYRFWSTKHKYSVDDLVAAEKGPLFVHSGLHRNEFVEHAASMAALTQSASDPLRRIDSASPETFDMIVGRLHAIIEKNGEQ